MQRTWPLANHPEFSVIVFPGYRELKVENFRLARDGSGRAIRGTSGLAWREAILFGAGAYVWQTMPKNFANVGALLAILLFLIWQKCTQILSESVVIVGHHGIQLETHRGFPPWTLSTTRQFVPACTLQDFIINEGLSRWNVRYYLAAMRRSSENLYALHVAFPAILPHFPVLEEVYNQVHTSSIFVHKKAKYSTKS